MIDPRNLIDCLKNKDTQKIKEILNSKRSNFAILLCNLEYNSNIGGIIRTNNAFLGKEVFILGKRKFNRKPCIGPYIYENLRFCSDLENLRVAASDYTWIGVDNIPDAVSTVNYKWPNKPLLCFGHEKFGLNVMPELVNLCKDIIYIPQLGSTRSLNVSVAAGIVMHEYCRSQNYLS